MLLWNSDALLVGLAVLLGGCHSPTPRSSFQMPFHVAVAPVVIETTDSAEPGSFSISLDSAFVSTELGAALNRDCFARVTLLDLPRGTTLREFASMSRERQLLLCQDQAKAEGASLVLLSSIKTSRRVSHGLNETFWLNLPLFFLGGPLCWFVNDRSYLSPASLNAMLYDMGPLSAGDPPALLTSISAESAPEVRLDLLRRSGNNIGYHLLSILVPAGLVAKHTGFVKANVRNLVVDQVIDDLSQRLNQSEQEVFVARRMLSFHPEAVRITRSSSNTLQFEADVMLFREGGVDRLSRFSLLVEGNLKRAADFPEGVDVDGRTSYRISEEIHIPANADFIELRIMDASTASKQRAYTYSLPSQEGSRIAYVKSTMIQSR